MRTLQNYMDSWQPPFSSPVLYLYVSFFALRFDQKLAVKAFFCVSQKLAFGLGNCCLFVALSPAKNVDCLLVCITSYLKSILQDGI